MTNKTERLQEQIQPELVMAKKFAGSQLSRATELRFLGPISLGGREMELALVARPTLAKFAAGQEEGFPYINGWHNVLPPERAIEWMTSGSTLPSTLEMIWRQLAKLVLARRPFRDARRPQEIPVHLRQAHDLQPDMRLLLPAQRAVDGAVNMLLAFSLLTGADPEAHIVSTQGLKNLAGKNGLRVDFRALVNGTAEVISQSVVERLLAGGRLKPEWLSEYGNEAAFWLAMSALEHSFGPEGRSIRWKGREVIYPYPMLMRTDLGVSPNPHIYLLPSIGAANVLYLSQIPRYLPAGMSFAPEEAVGLMHQWFEFARRMLMEYAQQQLGVERGEIFEVLKEAGAYLNRRKPLNEQVDGFYSQPLVAVYHIIKKLHGPEVAGDWRRVAEKCESLYDNFLEVLQGFRTGRYNRMSAEESGLGEVQTYGQWKNELMKSGMDTARSPASFSWSLIRQVRGRK